MKKIQSSASTEFIK